ncbi:hypothetical protein ACIA98_42610 [Streptomyces sp. NPDC051366]|uniref:hypothetical protein n=1 Tax=Streptomyces sp. NPDC051366 TaxID=3365652 RepID=UPI0037B71BCD
MNESRAAFNAAAAAYVAAYTDEFEAELGKDRLAREARDGLPVREVAARIKTWTSCSCSSPVTAVPVPASPHRATGASVYGKPAAPGQGGGKSVCPAPAWRPGRAGARTLGS